jgi:hypothetical protein
MSDKQERFDTGGGAHVGGDVEVPGGEFVGRDQTTHFDQRGQQVGVQINVAGDLYGPPPAPAPAAGAAPAVDTAALRARLGRLDAVEIEGLCLDHFAQVYDRFGRGQRRDEMINLLLDHCRRNPEEAARLAALLP